MKLFVLKLLSLLVFCLGLISLGFALGLQEVQTWLVGPALEYLVQLQGELPPSLEFLKGVLTPQGLWFGGSVIAIVLGIYGFFPRLAKFRKKKKIAYTGPHGEVQIQLDSVEQSLNHVLARMPEIRRITVRVDPQDNGRKALIKADVVLNQQPGQNARAIAGLVSDYIAETATKLLGLEELATIDLNVIGISVNSRKSSKAIRKESLSHSANAPVELLEAAPKPLTLSGPSEPLGSEPIEEEIEEEAEAALDTRAIDTRRDESNQAAARSALLEPLNMGEPLSDRHDDADGEQEVQYAEAHVHQAAQQPVDSGESHTQQSVNPIHMDSLNESLESAEEEAEEAFEDDGEGAAGENAAQELDSERHGAFEDTEDEGETAAGEFEPCDSGDSAETGQFAPESGNSDDATPAYPWESSAPAPVGEAESADTAATGEDPSHPEVPDTHESTGAEIDTDAAPGESPDDVTIPDTDEGAARPAESEKKRWGSWFN